MSTTPAGAAPTFHTSRADLPRLSVSAALSALLAIGATQAIAQPVAPDHRPGFELVVASGSLMPTGALRDEIRRADVTTAQLSYVLRPSVALTASTGWARSRDIASVGNPKLDVFSYDLGVECRGDRWMLGKTMSLSSFGGIGAGGRSYRHRHSEVDATHNLAAYGSLGGELGYRRMRLRLEARDYVTGFKPMVLQGARGRRNDVVVMAGLRFAPRAR
jgi:hypothetical protein